MEIVERNQHYTVDDGRNDTLSDESSVEWGDDNTPLRLIRIHHEQDYATYRLEGHMDDNSTYATVEFRGERAGDRARLYLACYLEADGFRPAEDAAHFPSIEIINLPRHFIAAYLFAATSNSLSWVAHTMFPNVEDDREFEQNRKTVYSYISRVRCDYPDLMGEVERGEE